MKRYSLIGIAVLCIAVIAIGAGCAKKDAGSEHAGVSADALSKLRPEEAAKAVTFKNGSSFLVTQRATLYEGRLAAEDESSNARVVEVTSFFRTSAAELSWAQVQHVPTQASRAARDAFASGEHEEGEAPPALAYEDVQAEGVLRSVELMKSHELGLPTAWAPGEAHAHSSAVWVSDDVFLELSRTRTSTVYTKALETANRATLGNAELQTVVHALREHVRDISGRVEVDLMKAEGDVVEVPLTVNGTEIRVQAIKARNWFGEILVLNNPQNPLILKFEFNPSMEGIEAGSEQMNLIKSILSFEVTDVML